MKISLIAAIAEKNRAIGKDNKLIWKIPDDLKRFKELTTGHPVIMGRKTFESIGRLLPNRTNIIITRDKEYKVEGAIIAHSLEEAIEKAKQEPSLRSSSAGEAISEEIFIIGGGQIFKQAIGLANKLYLTIIEARLPSPEGEANGGQGEFEGDAFFPEYSEFKKVISEKSGEHNGIKYKFLELEK